MHAFPTIKSFFAPILSQELPPSKVFVIKDGSLFRVEANEVAVIDQTHYLVDVTNNSAEYDYLPNMPIIARKKNV